MINYIMEVLSIVGVLFLYGGSIAFALLLSGMFISSLSSKDIIEEDDMEKKMIEMCNNLNIENKFIEEYTALLPNPDLSMNDLKETYMEFPHLNAQVLMYYDETFCYYSNKDIIYKYLNVVCRKFVIDNNAKQLYQDSSVNETIEPAISSSLFITKQETITQDKKINNFVRKGSLIDYEQRKNKKEIKAIDISDFLKGKKIN